MNSSSSHLSAMIAILVLPFGVPAAVLADDAPMNDVAMDLSLPADHPMLQTPTPDRRVPIEPLGAPTLSRFDLPMLGSALDLADTP